MNKTNNQIPVFIRSAYGEERVYAADSQHANALKYLTNCKTLPPMHLAGLEKLGFESVPVVDPSLKTRLSRYKGL